ARGSRKGMQSLGLEAVGERDEGRAVEVGGEADELPRAAEELGIDLSPAAVRAAARGPTAEEVEEGTTRADETGELTLPADEVLGEEVEAEDEEETALDIGDFEAEVADVEGEG